MKKYRIPRNLCQGCYECAGRFIMDCYCILCEECYERRAMRDSKCGLCGKMTKGNKIDAKQEESIQKISHLFENVDTGLAKILEVTKFQSELASRYCQHLEKQISAYQSAINELISYNPSLKPYFDSRIRNKSSHTQKQHLSTTHSVKASSTIKPVNRQFNSQLYESRRTSLQANPNQRPRGHQDAPGVRPVVQQKSSLSGGDAVYKVPNLNYNTAFRSSKREVYKKMAPNQEEQRNYFHRRH